MITHLPGEPIYATTVAELTHTAVPSHHVLHVLTGTELLIDDRDGLGDWWSSAVAAFAPAVIAELNAWLWVLRYGTARKRPRARSTIVTNLNVILPFLRAHPEYSTLREVTHSDVAGWLRGVQDTSRPASALRSLFATLKAQRHIFANPMQGISAGTARRTIPLPLTAAELRTVAEAAASNPACAVVIALTGIHALTSTQLRTLEIDDVDLHDQRLIIGVGSRPLGTVTATAVERYLAMRHKRWPRTSNRHLLISRNTATTVDPVGSYWIDTVLRGLPINVRRLREDRILDEAAATGDDPLHLAHVFGIGTDASLRYTTRESS